MTESPGIDITVPHPTRVYDYWLGGKDNYGPTARPRRSDQDLEDGGVGRCARVPVPRGHLSDRRGGDTAVPRPRLRPAVGAERARGRAVDGRQPGGLRGPRSDRAAARQGPVRESPRGSNRLHPGRHQEHRRHPGQGGGDNRFQPARRGHAAGGAALRHRRPGPGRAHARSWTPCRPEATSRSAITRPTSTRRYARSPPACASSTRPSSPGNRQQVANLFAGLDLVEPGVVEISRWRPESDPGTGAAPLWGGVARKP